MPIYFVFGINAMWISSSFGPDLTNQVTFSGVTGCEQTNNGIVNGCGGMQGCLVD